MTTSIRPTPRRYGFTLVELLVVIGIITIVAGLIGVVVARARKGASKFQIDAQLQQLAVGLEAYKSDFSAYPTTSQGALTTTTADDVIGFVGSRGARVLCKALMGTNEQGATSPTATPNFMLDRKNQDGNEGLGFRVPPRSGFFQLDATDNTKLAGKVYGPYLSTSLFKYSKTTATATSGVLDDASTDSDSNMLLDVNGRPILYYPVINLQAPVDVAKYYVGDETNNLSPMYRGTDNTAWLPLGFLRRKLGDLSLNGGIDAGETAAVKGKYLLWSSGVDEIFGINTKLPANSADSYDDVTNFQGE